MCNNKLAQDKRAGVLRRKHHRAGGCPHAAVFQSLEMDKRQPENECAYPITQVACFVQTYARLCPYYFTKLFCIQFQYLSLCSL